LELEKWPNNEHEVFKRNDGLFDLVMVFENDVISPPSWHPVPWPPVPVPPPVRP